MNTFRTSSSSQKMVRTILYTGIPLFALAFLGLKVSVITWLYFEGMIALCLGICLMIVSKTHWEIQFKDDKVLVYNTGNRQSYVFEQIKQSDFHIKQSQKQKKNDTCDMKIEDSIFIFSDVQSCQEMLAYIRDNFPN